MEQANHTDVAIAAFLAGYRDNGAATVAAVVAAAKQAAAEKKGMQASLFVGFLALAAAGADPQAVRATGAAIRRAVTRTMRVSVGLPADKPKGAKESGAPDFSTASVYAGVVADSLSAQRDNANAWAAAFDAIGSATDTPPTMHACGLYDAISACKRTLSKYAELCEAEMVQRHPSLAATGGDSTAIGQTLASLQQELTMLRAYREAHLQPGDHAEMVAMARSERAQAMEALSTAQAVAARQAAELGELRAIAAEAARVFGKSGAELVAELAGTEAVAAE